MGLFKRKPKCVHNWQIIEGLIDWEGDNDPYWERYHDITKLRGFCKTCGITSSWKIANWKMTDEQVKAYVREVYGQ